MSALMVVASEMPRFQNELIRRFRQSDEAQTYLQSRGIGLGFAHQFGVGWCPPEAYSQYRGRVMFPIRTPRGDILAYTARLLEAQDERAKYWHASFPKTKTLFGLHESMTQLESSRRVLLVEGALDALMLQQAGLHAVAYMSAMPSRAQLVALTCLYSELVLWPDRDDAGARTIDGAVRRHSGLPSTLGVLKIPSSLKSLRPEFKDAADFLFHHSAHLHKLTKVLWLSKG